MNYRMDWTKIGEQYTGSDSFKRKVLYSITGIDSQSDGHGEWDRWIEIPQDGTPLRLAMMPGMGIKEAILQLHLPKVSHVGISAGCAPFGLYGMRAHYKGDQTIDVFVLDTGDSITPLCGRVWETACEVPA